MAASLPIAAVGLAAAIAAEPASAIFGWPSLTFSVGSQSMAPGLTVDDIILFPQMFAAAPRRGDVVIHRGEMAGRSTIFIKRVVGLPGDRVQYVGGVLVLNGEAVPREPIAAPANLSELGVDGLAAYRETIDGASYVILESDEPGVLDDTEETTVPPGSYFGLGDNRDNSVDSRLPEQGAIPAGSILGRACLRYRFPVTFISGCSR